MEGAGRDQHNTMKTNKTHSCLTKTFKILYNFKIPLIIHTTVRNGREMAHKKKMRPNLLDCLNKHQE